MPREVDVRAELSRKFEALDQAVQLGHSPVVDGLSQFHRAFRYAAPVGAAVVQRVGEFYPAEFFGRSQGVP